LKPFNPQPPALPLAAAELVLVRPKVARPYDYITFSCTIGFVIAHLVSLALWMFGLFQTRLRFFYVLIVSAVLGIVLSTINVLVYYDPKLMPQILGPRGFALFFYWYIWLLLFQFVLSLIGATIMVRWICGANATRA
jgi:hypothetical protein